MWHLVMNLMVMSFTGMHGEKRSYSIPRKKSSWGFQRLHTFWKSNGGMYVVKARVKQFQWYTIYAQSCTGEKRENDGCLDPSFVLLMRKKEKKKKKRKKRKKKIKDNKKGIEKTCKRERIVTLGRRCPTLPPVTQNAICDMENQSLPTLTSCTTSESTRSETQRDGDE